MESDTGIRRPFVQCHFPPRDCKQGGDARRAAATASSPLTPRGHGRRPDAAKSGLRWKDGTWQKSERCSGGGGGGGLWVVYTALMLIKAEKKRAGITRMNEEGNNQQDADKETRQKTKKG